MIHTDTKLLIYKQTGFFLHITHTHTTHTVTKDSYLLFIKAPFPPSFSVKSYSVNIFFLDNLLIYMLLKISMMKKKKVWSYSVSSIWNLLPYTSTSPIKRGQMEIVRCSEFIEWHRQNYPVCHLYIQTSRKYERSLNVICFSWTLEEGNISHEFVTYMTIYND